MKLWNFFTSIMALTRGIVDVEPNKNHRSLVEHDTNLIHTDNPMLPLTDRLADKTKHKASELREEAKKTFRPKNKKSIAQAVKLMYQARELDPDAAGQNLEIGRFYKEWGAKYRGVATKHFAVEINRNASTDLVVQAHFERAQVNQQHKHYAESLADLKVVYEKYPEHVLAARAKEIMPRIEALSLKKEAYKTNENSLKGNQQMATELALSLISRAIEICPKEAWLHLDRARYNKYLGYYEAAEAEYIAELNLAAHPHAVATARVEKGDLNYELEKYAEALNDYQVFVDKFPLHPRAKNAAKLIGEIKVIIKVKEVSEFRKKADEVFKQQPNAEGAKLAVQIMDEAIARNSEAAGQNLDQAKYNAFLGKRKEVMANLAAEIAIGDPEATAQALMERSVFYQEDGMNTEALDDLNMALSSYHKIDRKKVKERIEEVKAAEVAKQKEIEERPLDKKFDIKNLGEPAGLIQAMKDHPNSYLTQVRREMMAEKGTINYFTNNALRYRELLEQQSVVPDDQQELFTSYKNGLADLKAGRYESAIDHFDQQEKTGNVISSNALFRGLAHLSMRNHKEAVQDFTLFLNQRLRETKISVRRVPELRAIAYTNQGMFEKAKSDLDQEEPHGIYEAIGRRGAINQILGRNQEAENDFKKEKEFAEKYGPYHINLEAQPYVPVLCVAFVILCCHFCKTSEKNQKSEAQEAIEWLARDIVDDVCKSESEEEKNWLVKLTIQDIQEIGNNVTTAGTTREGFEQLITNKLQDIEGGELSELDKKMRDRFLKAYDDVQCYKTVEEQNDRKTNNMINFVYNQTPPEELDEEMLKHYIKIFDSEFESYLMAVRKNYNAVAAAPNTSFNAVEFSGVAIVKDHQH